MWVIADTETNRLENPDKLWVVVCKDIDTGERYVFERPDLDPKPLQDFASGVDVWIGHNFIGFDYAVLARICNVVIVRDSIIDTLVVSRLLNYSQDGGHSVEAWGEHFGYPKVKVTPEEFEEGDIPRMIERCSTDTEIQYKIFKEFEDYIFDETWSDALSTEHFQAWFCQELHDTGFWFNIDDAMRMRDTIAKRMEDLNNEFQSIFPPKAKLIREINPKATKHGTIHLGDFRWLGKGADLSPYSVDAPFSLFEYEPFNPGSHKQLVERLNEAGWKPIDKTDGHIQAERDVWGGVEGAKEKLERLRVTGWQVNETNLETLPSGTPESIRKLASYLTLRGRLSRLDEWIGVYNHETHRIHGRFNPIGAWTQRKSHDKPNMANIPKIVEYREGMKPVEAIQAEFNGPMRALWGVPEDRLLIGVDAEGIQLRILAHYINSKEFTNALIHGNKKAGSDPHSINQKRINALASDTIICRSRNAAKTFIYAWILNAGVARVSQIFECSADAARTVRDGFLDFYPGLRELKEEQVPFDAARGYFDGLDGRKVMIYGDDVKHREHLTLAGYLQNGETIVMKRAAQIWYPKLRMEKVPFWIVNDVHDEWQTETIDDMDCATYIAQTQADAIRMVGEDLRLNCPLAGSYVNDHGGFTIGKNWKDTH